MNTCRILVVRLGAMGDVIHALPAVASLKQSFPHCYLSWTIEARWAPLLAGNPFVDEIIEVDRRSLTSLSELRRKLRSASWDFAVDFQGLLKSALVASIARPERIYGFHRFQVREPLAALFYSRTVKTGAGHVVDRNLELAQGAGAFCTVKAFPIPAGDPEGHLPAGPFVLASPLAGWTSKQWPAEYYAALADLLDIPLVLNVPPGVNLPCGRAILHESGLSGLIDATRRASAVVGVDSGPMHLAAALGKSGVAIFGPTDASRNGPYGGSLRVLRSPGALTSYKRGDQIDDSMKAITPAEVASALLEKLQWSFTAGNQTSSTAPGG